MDIASFTGTCSTGGGSGGGTVTSITEDVNLFPEVLVNGVVSYTITGSGTFAWSKVVQQPNTFWAGPTTAPAAVPVFRPLVPADGNGAFWTIIGNLGTDANAGNFIGTIDNADWAIRTNNLERVRVVGPGGGSSAPGYVGINNSAPSRLLDVGPSSANINGGLGIARAMLQDTGSTGGAVYNVKAYGAAGDGTDDTAFITAAANQARIDYGTKGANPNWGATLYFPPGTYRCDAIRPNGAALDFPLNLLGSGIGVTIIKGQVAVDTVGRLFEYNLLSPALNQTNPDGLFHGPLIRDISFDADPAHRPEFHVLVNAANALLPGGSTKPVEGTRVIDVEMNRAVNGLGLYENAAAVIDHLVTRPGNYAREIILSNTSFPDAGDSTITRCDFQSRNMVGGYQLEHVGTNGTRIVNNKFNGSAGIGDGPASHILFKGPISPSEIIIVANSFEGSDYYSIRCEGAWGAGGRNVISSNQFDDAFKGKGGQRISIAPSGAGSSFAWQITNNNFERAADDGNNQNVIELIPTGTSTLDNFTISGNSFRGARAGDTAIYANAAVATLHIGDNGYYGFTQPVDTTTATGEGITLAFAKSFGNFIMCKKDGTAGANQKFWVEPNGNSRSRFLDVGPRADGFVASPLYSAFIGEDNYQPVNGSLGIYTPRAGAGAGIDMRQDTGVYTGNALQINMGVDGAGAASGTFTGNFLLFHKYGVTGTEQKFRFATNGTMFSRALDIGPRSDADLAVTDAIQVSDANYTAMSGNMMNIVQAAASARSGIYQRNDTAAYTGAFFKVQAGTNAAGAASGSFTGMVLDYQYPQGTQKAFLDYQPQLCFAKIAAPAAYGAGFGQIYFDSADNKWHVVDGAGNHAI